MRRREFVAGLASAAAWRIAAHGQQRDRMRLVAILLPYPESDVNAQTRVRILRQELAKLGWLEGADIRFDVRWTTDNMDIVRAAAASLVGANPDAIVSYGDRVIAVFEQMTRTIPIVAMASELVGSGFVDSLARPAGNVTGFSVLEFSVIGKMVETLRQIAPGVSRVGMIYNPDNPVGAIYWRSFNTVAAQLAIEPLDYPVHGVAEIERAIASLAEHPNGGLIAAPDVTLIGLAAQVTSLAARYRVPTMYSTSLFTSQGGLASYGADINDMVRRQAAYVHRILRGEKPSDLPIQQPTSYQLVINLKTANALGLTIPETLLATADEVIQ
jgi:putative ABC transport system substrate-binding protein